jgi:hypothetical protein
MSAKAQEVDAWSWASVDRAAASRKWREVSGLATWDRGRTSTPCKNGVARIGRGRTDPRFDCDFPDDMVFAKGRRTREEQQQQEQPKESTLAAHQEVGGVRGDTSCPDIRRHLQDVRGCVEDGAGFRGGDDQEMPRDCPLSTTRTLQETRDRLIENFRSLETKIHQDLQDIRRRFNERIGQEIVKVTSDAIAEALTTCANSTHCSAW